MIITTTKANKINKRNNNLITKQGRYKANCTSEKYRYGTIQNSSIMFGEINTAALGGTRDKRYAGATPFRMSSSLSVE